MKAIFALSLCFFTSQLFAQSPQQIEKDLLKSFKKIDAFKIDNTDANDMFAKKLYSYIIHNPATINYPFTSLKKQQLNVITSTDGLFRIYSWDTCTGGTMHFFESIFQYKTGIKNQAILDTPKQEGDVRPWYDKLYTLKTRNQVYYLATTINIGSTKDYGGSIQIFDIENGKLNDSVKLIKTSTGLHSNIEYWYDLSKRAGKLSTKDYPSIEVDLVKQTISIPLVLENGAATTKYIIYKFTGQYFERVMN